MNGRPFIITLVAALAAVRGEPLGNDLRCRISARQLLVSLVEHPAEWHDEIPGGLSQVFDIWADQLGVRPSPADLDEIHQRLDPEFRKLFSMGLGSRA